MRLHLENKAIKENKMANKPNKNSHKNSAPSISKGSVSRTRVRVTLTLCARLISVRSRWIRESYGRGIFDSQIPCGRAKETLGSNCAGNGRFFILGSTHSPSLTVLSQVRWPLSHLESEIPNPKGCGSSRISNWRKLALWFRGQQGNEKAAPAPCLPCKAF